MVQTFAIYLRNICNCVIYVDLLEKDKTRLATPKTWYSDMLKSSTFVIIVCSEEDDKKSSSDIFQDSIEMAMAKQRTSNDVRIIPVKFSLSANETVPSCLNQSCLKLMEEFADLYRRIDIPREIPKQLQSMVSYEKYTECKEGSELKQALDNARTALKQTQVVEDLTKPHLKYSEKESGKVNDFNIMDEIAKLMTPSSSLNTLSLQSVDRESGLDIAEGTPFLHREPDQMAINKDLASNQNCAQNNNIKSTEHTGSDHPIRCKASCRSGIVKKEKLDSQQFEHFNSTKQHHIKCFPHHFLGTEQFYKPDHSTVCYQNMNCPRCQYFPHEPVSPQVLRYSEKRTCPLHGNREETESLLTENNVQNVFFMGVSSDGYGYVPSKTYHSYPHDNYSDHMNQHVGDDVKQRFQFLAVDPHNSSNYSCKTLVGSQNQNKYATDQEFDSGYASGLPYKFAEPGPDNMELHEIQENRIPIVEIHCDKLVQNPADQINWNDYQKASDGKYSVNSRKRNNELSSSARYSYPLSLSKKREFTSDMFIPPDDIDSCFSDNERGSEELMDQLADFNDKMEH